MSYVIYVYGSTETATKKEIAEEGRKLVGALDGVSGATLNWTHGADAELVDLTKPAAD